MQPISTRPWRTPSFVEIPMNAEVGSYQNEFDERKHEVPRVPPARKP
jgi:hypothetical protein